jgi:hypothetical protein
MCDEHVGIGASLHLENDLRHHFVCPDNTTLTVTPGDRKISPSFCVSAEANPSGVNPST